MNQRQPASTRAILLRAMVIIAVMVVLFGGSVVGYGFVRNEPVKGHAEVIISAPREQVFALLADPRRTPEWRTEVEAIHDYRETGNGLAAWTEVSGGAELDLRISERVDNERIVIVVDDEFAHYRGEWVFTFSDHEGGTRLAVTEAGEVPNPFIRGMFHLLANRDKTQQAHLDSIRIYIEHLNRQHPEEP
jgi:uncharacterized protein YndB with AHSA1/START domain